MHGLDLIHLLSLPFLLQGQDNRELNLNNKLLTGDATRPQLKINDFTYRWVVGGS